MYETNKHLIDENKSSEFSEILQKDEAARSSLVSIFNFLEAVAVGVEFGIMDKDLIKKCFKSLFINYLNNYEFYILYRRKKNNNPNAWINFTQMAVNWRNNEN